MTLEVCIPTVTVGLEGWQRVSLEGLPCAALGVTTLTQGPALRKQGQAPHQREPPCVWLNEV